VLKEVRRKIADANNIPLQEREWTPATVSDGKPVSSIVTVRLRDLR
jgi:hypothetical protein